MQTRTRRLAALGGLTVALAIPSLSPAQAATTTEVVTQADVTRQAENTPPTDNWVEYFRTPTSEATWEDGPGDPPLGNGSVELSTPTGTDKVQVFNYDHVGTRLADITDIAYSTYRTAGSGQQVVALNLVVDENGPAVAGGFTTLVFEPVYNTGQGSVVSGSWQDWDAVPTGIWWSTRTIPGVCAFDCFVTWNAIVAANPDATILGAFGLNQGSGNPGLVSNADALTIAHNGDTYVYDFERIRDLDGDGTADTPPPTNKDQCKKDGYKSFNNPSFRNQGDCVSYTNGRR